MKAGLLSEQVEILRQEKHASDYGGDRYEWVVDRKARARVTHKGGSFGAQGFEAFPEVIVEFEFNYFQKLLYTDRIRHAGQVYSIEDIDNNRLLRRVTVKTTRVNE